MTASPQTLSGFARLDEFIADLEPVIRRTRRRLHERPELSGAEYETTTALAEALDGSGLILRRGPDNRGLVVDSPAPPGTPRVALRGDIDALPIQDLKTTDYRSRIPGVMHACGHDAHASIALGATLALARLAASGDLPWPLAWRTILQPAEENARGAREMIAAGALADVRALFALHVDPSRNYGSAGVKDGPFTAECDWFDIKIEGSGGHAARPHESHDPIAAAAQLISSIYALLPRAVDSRNPAVVTVGRIVAGHGPNVIPDDALLQGTIRSVDPATRDRTVDRLRQLTRGMAEAAGVHIDLSFSESLPGVRNDPALNRLIRRAAGDVLGADAVETIDKPSMGGEDFAAYLEHAPGAMFRLGVRSGALGAAPLHSPHFDLDERALAAGARILARAALLWAAPEEREGNHG